MARHAYLGELEDVAHPPPAHYANGSVVELPLMILRDIVLFPGEELPLRVLSDTSLEAIRARLANETSMLAVLCPGQGDPSYGTTVRVERIGLIDNTATLTGAAKQRFRLKSMKSSPGGRGIFGTVEILADVSPPRLPFPALWRRPHESTDAAQQQQHKSSRRRRLRSRFPSFWGISEYALFDATQLVDRIQQIMISSAHCNWFRKLASQEPNKESMVKHLTNPSDQQDPVRFAFWIAANLPVSHTVRLELLKTECIVRLLRRAIELLEDLDESIYCSRCGTFLAQTRDIFSMTNDGAAGTFVNPGGFVHQIMTLREVHMDRLFVDATRSTEDSWFPGYAWSIAHCGVCYNHLGWQFDSAETPLLAPARFFGFRRTALAQSWSADHAISRPNWDFVDDEDDYSDHHDDENDSIDDHDRDGDDDTNSDRDTSTSMQVASGEDVDSESSSDSNRASDEEFFDAVGMD